MIRYDQAGDLIPSVSRTEAGYRVYAENDVHTLRFVCRARDLEFSVEQISEVLALWRDRSRASVDIKRITLRHIKELERKARELGEMARTLQHLAATCQDRKSVGKGKSVSVRVDLGGRRIIKKKQKYDHKLTILITTQNKNK